MFLNFSWKSAGMPSVQRGQNQNCSAKGYCMEPRSRIEKDWELGNERAFK